MCSFVVIKAENVSGIFNIIYHRGLIDPSADWQNSTRNQYPEGRVGYKSSKSKVGETHLSRGRVCGSPDFKGLAGFLAQQLHALFRVCQQHLHIKGQQHGFRCPGDDPAQCPDIPRFKHSKSDFVESIFRHPLVADCFQHLDRAGEILIPRESNGHLFGQFNAQVLRIEGAKFVVAHLGDSPVSEDQFRMQRRLGNRHSADCILVACADFAVATLLELLAAAAGAGIIAPGLGNGSLHRGTTPQGGLRHRVTRD